MPIILQGSVYCIVLGAIALHIILKLIGIDGMYAHATLIDIWFGFYAARKVKRKLFDKTISRP